MAGLMELQPEQIDILIVEDNPGDVRLIREAFAATQTPPKRLHVVPDGGEALDFLFRRGAHAKAPVPDLVLLDMNLPKESGMEVLAVIKQDPVLRRIVVVVTTVFADPEMIRRAYDLQANCCVLKPAGLDDLFRMVDSIQEFWFRLVSLPARSCNRQLRGGAGN